MVITLKKIKNPLYQIENVRQIMKGRIPGQLIIQFTNGCNATCPQCSMRKTENYPRSKLSEKELIKILDSAQDQRIQAVSFTGGEPFLYQTSLMKMLHYASERDIPYLRTGTNGFMFTNSENPGFDDRIHRFAQELSKTRLRNFWISIDSADPSTHEEMRGLKGVIKGIEKALPIFHQHGIYPAANLGINRNTGGKGKIPIEMMDKETFHGEAKEAFSLFYRFVIDLGFTMVNACYPMSVNPAENSSMNAVYGASSSNPIINFTGEEKIQLFQALMDTIPKYRGDIRIFTPLISLYSLIKHYSGEKDYSLPCRGGIDFYFVDANDGNTYPCGYRGNENLGKFYEMDVASKKEKPFCKACDWECFRDPSELIGYFIESFRHPLRHMTTAPKNSCYRKLWKEDLKYYISCDFFDGRTARHT